MAREYPISPTLVNHSSVVAVMRGNLKQGYHRHRSNKHYRKQIVRVLLDSGSDRDLV